MASYQADRAFSEYVHRHLALPRYARMGWKPVALEAAHAHHFDTSKGIDRIFWAQDRLITVQERFRERRYARYSDFTIRYRRDHSRRPECRRSEFFKLKADYFAYGIANGPKQQPEHCTAFLKFALIDLKALYRQLAAGRIRIEDKGAQRCQLEGRVLVCPVRHNRDYSSSFVPFEIPLLLHLWGAEVVVLQEGFA